MKKKLFFLATISLFSISLIGLLVLTYPAYALPSGTTYVRRINNVFPCPGTCNAFLDFSPLGSETSCPHQCSNDWSKTCPVPETYTNYTRKCWLTEACGCNYKYKCPDTYQCVQLKVSDWNNGSCNSSSCCIAGEKWIKTLCIKCNQEVKNGNSIVDINECLKKSQCGDPCSFLCPPSHCEVINASLTGLGKGYNCVPNSPIAKSDSNTQTVSIAATAAAGGNTTPMQCQCKTLVGQGTWQWCPADKKKNCCRNDTPCCGKTCCKLVEKGKTIAKCETMDPNSGEGMMNPLVCKPLECANADEVFCKAKDRSVCCRKNKDGSSPCGVINVGGYEIAICNPNPGDCPAPLIKCKGQWPSDSNAFVCCNNETQECNRVPKAGTPFCQAKTDKDCPEGTFLCTSTEDNIKKCCNNGTTCVPDGPGGFPYCMTP
jgi:hypothetical protein